MRILFLGDIVGRPGREAVRRNLSRLREELELDLVLANGENASGGLGLMPKSAKELFSAGVDLLTSGNHIWRYKEIEEYFQREPMLLRPANYPPGAPGSGLGFVETPKGRVAVLNLQGRTYMEPLDCPFQTAVRQLAKVPEDVVLRVVDFHAEATSEKKAMGFFLDGRVSAVLGTHTHVQTSDAQLLPRGSAFLTDLGMCGVEHSVLGMDHRNIVERFVLGRPKRFELAEGQADLRGAILDLDEASGRARRIELFAQPA